MCGVFPAGENLFNPHREAESEILGPFKPVGFSLGSSWAVP